MADERSRPGGHRRTTAALLIGLRGGDPAARDAIVKRYVETLQRLAHGRLPHGARGRYESEELAHDAVMRGLQKSDSFEDRGPGAFLAYLRRILLNLIRDEIRRASRRPAETAVDDRLPDIQPTPLTALMSRETLVRYEEALAGLPKAQQEAVQLRVEGYSFKEIAELTGRPSADAARMLVKRGMGRVAEHMRQAGATE